MTMRHEQLNKTLNNDFAVLNEENKKNVIEMLRFLVLAQETIVPEMLSSKFQKNKKKERST